MLDSPLARVAARALVVFATTFLTMLAASEDPTGQAALTAAFVGALLAAMELLTPINKSVGAFSEG
jgi:hypothetical protein